MGKGRSYFGGWTFCGIEGQEHCLQNEHIHHMDDKYCWALIFCGYRVSPSLFLCNHIGHNCMWCFGAWTSCGNKGQKYFSSNYHIHHTIDRYCCASIFCGHEVSQRLLLWNCIDHNYTHYFGDWIYCGIKGQWYLLPNNRIQCRGGKRCCAFSKWLLSCQKRSVLKCHTVHMSILLPHA